MLLSSQRIFPFSVFFKNGNINLLGATNKINPPKKRKTQKFTTEARCALGSLPYPGPGTFPAVRSLLSVFLSLYKSEEVLSSGCYMTHLLPKVSAHFVHRPSRAKLLTGERAESSVSLRLQSVQVQSFIRPRKKLEMPSRIE